RGLERKSAERRIKLWMRLSDTAEGLALTLVDEDGYRATVELALAKEPAKDAARAEAALREHLGKLGATIFEAVEIVLDLAQPWFVPASLVNQLRREGVAALEAARLAALPRLERARPVEPPVPYPAEHLTYLANVFNHKARDFYARHGVKLIDAAFEAHEEEGEVSLMITKHCVRYSLSLCPKQTRGVIGVHGTIKAEPLWLMNGSEKLKLVFDCKPCEMHVVGKLKRSVARERAREVRAVPMQFYRSRP
ncbi:MAG: DUF3656 domain-containing protein, partial [Halothiobacillaceae bacterium]